MLRKHLLLALPALVGIACGGKTVLDEPGLYAWLDSGTESSSDAGLDAKVGDAKPEVSVSETGPSWGCTQVVTSQGPMCTCAQPPPPGQPVAPANCNLAAGYDCCEWDGKTCSCRPGYDCKQQGDSIVEQCGEINLCPYPLVQPYGACTKPGLKCPGEGMDPYCWNWRCTCGISGWQCSPGICS